MSEDCSVAYLVAPQRRGKLGFLLPVTQHNEQWQGGHACSCLRNVLENKSLQNHWSLFMGTKQCRALRLWDLLCLNNAPRLPRWPHRKSVTPSGMLSLTTGYVFVPKVTYSHHWMCAYWKKFPNKWLSNMGGRICLSFLHFILYGTSDKTGTEGAYRTYLFN